MTEETILTCVYCGHEYPAGTPASGADVQELTDHIKVCQQHPLRQAEKKISKLRAALIGMVGESEESELLNMKCAISNTAPCEETFALIDAIDALLET